MTKVQSNEETSSIQEPEVEIPSWKALGVSDALVALLEKQGFTSPTPIQQKALPAAIEGKDILGTARTGSGKTAAFGLPLIQKLAGRRGTLAIILCPTREIALQTLQTMEIFGLPLDVRTVAVIGGTDVKTDERALITSPQVIVATPGRLCDHMTRGNLWLEYVEFLVLDEADRMLDMGFSKELNQIVGAMPTQRQTMLFSATMPAEVESLCRKILKSPVRISIGKPLQVSSQVDHRLLWTNEADKKRELKHILSNEPGTIIVFTRTKDGATLLWRWIHAVGFHESTYLSSNKSQAHREEALEGFKVGRYRIMVATDVAARGIHVENVAMVINFDLPIEAEDYVHRIGRTGRKDANGVAISLVTDADVRQVERIEDFLRARLQDIFPPGAVRERPRGRSDRGGGGRGAGRGGSSRGGSSSGSGSRGGGSRGGRSGSSRGRR
jgi:superfamily II DNA/RNA helicase